MVITIQNSPGLKRNWYVLMMICFKKLNERKRIVENLELLKNCKSVLADILRSNGGGLIVQDYGMLNSVLVNLDLRIAEEERKLKESNIDK